jgi:hypothetical protein
MTKINIGVSERSVIVGDSVSNSNIVIQGDKVNEIFDQILEAVLTVEDRDERDKIESIVKEMQGSVGTDDYLKSYTKFMSMVSDHMTVFSPFLAGLAALLS